MAPAQQSGFSQSELRRAFKVAREFGQRVRIARCGDTTEIVFEPETKEDRLDSEFDLLDFKK